jgi:outer membrane lipoprotein-sorting protein
MFKSVKPETPMTPTRRTVALTLLASPFGGAAAAQARLSAADQALVDRATAYLQSLTEARGRFVQTDPRGATTQGSLYLKRPGKARFAYDAPSGLTVVSDGGNVAVHDARLKTFDRYPLSATPLSLFLAKNIRLDRGVTVTRVDRMADGFSITARDGSRKTAGQITLTFTDTPLALAAWTVTDAQGRSTRVRLQGLQRASGLANSLFVMRNPYRRPGASA